MEVGSGQNPVPSTNVDKTRVLDVKPLRTLVPMFPNSPQAPPFVCSSPLGPFPPGFAPFYPFSMQQNSQAQANPSKTDATTGAGFSSAQAPPEAMPAPIRSFKPPETTHLSNGDNQKRASPHMRSNQSQKKTRKSLSAGDSSLSIDVIRNSLGLTIQEKENGNRDLVEYIRMTFDALRRRLNQVEDSKGAPAGVIRRPDLKAGNVLMTAGIRTNMTKRVGVVSGVEVGDIFFFRMDMCAVGLHAPSMGGIDYMILRGGLDEEPVALSIVSSGGYDDDAEDRDVLIYSGQGGNASKKDKPASDQKLERGNLALERSLQRGNEVRVIRGMKDAVSASAKVYVYDGLYKIQESWTEKGKTGCNIFKYKLVRLPGQPGAFSVWKSIEKWKDGFSSRVGLVLPDLTSGAENIPVSLVNDVDGEKGPAYFTYIPTPKYTKAFTLTQPSFGCNCRNACAPGDLNCSCIRKNGGDFPYTANGVLVSRKPLIYECSPTCPCFANCKNRMSQTGLKVRLEVFKTNDRGWGLRSWDPIRAGTFICVYAGEVLDASKAQQSGEEGDNDDYIFNSTHVYNSFKWNYEPLLADEEKTDDSNEDYELPSPIIINAKNVGNVARFMNHSCSPNVFWQPIVYEYNHESFINIAYFAMKHIPPMTELTYDYGTSRPSTSTGQVSNVHHGKKKCLCGSAKCQGYFG